MKVSKKWIAGLSLAAMLGLAACDSEQSNAESETVEGDVSTAAAGRASAEDTGPRQVLAEAGISHETIEELADSEFDPETVRERLQSELESQGLDSEAAAARARELADTAARRLIEDSRVPEWGEAVTPAP